jgi:hypothetical protein
MALDRFAGDSHPLRDLVIGEAFAPAEQQHLALNGLQLGDGLLQALQLRFLRLRGVSASCLSYDPCSS